MFCETNSLSAKCGKAATTRLTQTYASVTALACDEHAAMWMRTKKVRGQVVRVHPNMVAEAI